VVDQVDVGAQGSADLAEQSLTITLLSRRRQRWSRDATSAPTVPQPSLLASRDVNAACGTTFAHHSVEVHNMGVQRQREKQLPRPGESREDQNDKRPKDDRVGDPFSEELIPVGDQEDEDDDESTEDPLTDPAAEPGTPI
jgi:hypothetical protein